MGIEALRWTSVCESRWRDAAVRFGALVLSDSHMRPSLIGNTLFHDMKESHLNDVIDTMFPLECEVGQVPATSSMRQGASYPL